MDFTPPSRPGTTSSLGVLREDVVLFRRVPGLNSSDAASYSNSAYPHPATKRAVLSFYGHVIFHCRSPEMAISLEDLRRPLPESAEIIVYERMAIDWRVRRWPPLQ